MNILKEADKIINSNEGDGERNYGPFDRSMSKAAKIATQLISKHITAGDMYLCMVAVKLAREAVSHKEDNLVDAVGYLAGLNDYLSKEE